MRAARDGRVRNWRWIDSFDASDTTYEFYKFLYPVSKDDAQNPSRPLPQKLRILEKRIARIDGVAHAFVGRLHRSIYFDGTFTSTLVSIGLRTRSPKLRNKVLGLIPAPFAYKVRYFCPSQ